MDTVTADLITRVTRLEDTVGGIAADLNRRLLALEGAGQQRAVDAQQDERAELVRLRHALVQAQQELGQRAAVDGA